MLNILCVEDDEKTRDVFTRFLKLKGHQVCEAKDGQQAVAFATQRRFDLVLMDVKMPTLDGISACRQIRTAAPTTTVVLMTGFSDSEDLQQVLQEGAVEYLHKPVTLDQLSALLERFRSSA